MHRSRKKILAKSSFYDAKKAYHISTHDYNMSRTVRSSIRINYETIGSFARNSTRAETSVVLKDAGSAITSLIVGFIFKPKQIYELLAKMKNQMKGAFLLHRCVFCTPSFPKRVYKKNLQNFSSCRSRKQNLILKFSFSDFYTAKSKIRPSFIDILSHSPNNI